MRCMCFYASPRTSAYAKHYSNQAVPFPLSPFPPPSRLASPALVPLSLSSFFPATSHAPSEHPQDATSENLCFVLNILSFSMSVCVYGCVYGCVWVWVRIFIWLFSCFFRAYIKMEIEYFMRIFANSTQLENKMKRYERKTKDADIYSMVDIYLDIYYISAHTYKFVCVSRGCCKNCHQQH